MTTILISLRSEFYKFKKSTILFSCLLMPLLIVALFIWGIGSRPAEDAFIQKAGSFIGAYQWSTYIGNIGNTLSLFLVPLFTMFIAYSVNDIEYKSDMWKSLFSLPLSKSGIYAGKYLFAIFLLFLTMFSFYVLSSVGLHLLSSINPHKFFYSQYTKGNQNLLLFFCKFFLSSLGILSVQMTFSFLWKDFFKPMGIGLLGMIVGNIWALGKPETAYLFPYAQPVRAAFIAHPAQLDAHLNLFEKFQLFSPEIVMSLLYLVVFAVLGFFIVARKNIK